MIGKWDSKTQREILSLKLDLIEMAHINNVKFFDVYNAVFTSLEHQEKNSKLLLGSLFNSSYSQAVQSENDGGKQLNHLIEDHNGPWPPFSLGRSSLENSSSLNSRRFQSGVWDSYDEKISDFLILYNCIVLVAPHLIRNTQFLTSVFTDEKINDRKSRNQGLVKKDGSLITVATMRLFNLAYQFFNN